MKLHEWEIWHTYSTYLHSRIPNLDAAARSLVHSGIALCAMHRDGRTYWRSKTGVQSGLALTRVDVSGCEATVEIKPDDIDSASFAPFTQEAMFQGSHFRFSELRLYGKDAPIPPPYIRMFLGQCNFISTKENAFITCYPILKLHESGVLILELRIIGPSRSMRTKEFIQNYIDLPRRSFNRVEVPPAVSRIGSRAYYHSLRRWPIRLRRKILVLEDLHDIAVEELTELRQEGDFTFSFAPLSREEGFPETLSSFSQSLFHLVAFILSTPRRGLGFVLRGQKSVIEVGSFWSGRPHIYLISFDQQEESSLENERLHKAEFGCMIAKHWPDSPETGSQYLPPDCRKSEDYNAYISSAATLWVWSRKGLKSRKKGISANHADLIYEPQATMEMLEYGYMIHRSLFERALGHGRSEDVLNARRDLAMLKHQFSEIGRFLEIRDLLQQGWDSMGIQDLQQRINESLAIRESETTLGEARTTERMGRVLAILFGLVAVPPIADYIVKPLWDYFELWQPNDPPLDKLFLVLIAFVVITALTFSLLRLVRKRPIT